MGLARVRRWFFGHKSQRSTAQPLSALLAACIGVGTLCSEPLPARGAPCAETQCEFPRLQKTRRYAVAALGDSLTDTRVGGGLYLKFLRELCPQSSFDAFGVGGQDTRLMRERFAKDVLSESSVDTGSTTAEAPYTHVLVLGGINDLIGQGVDERQVARARRNLAAIYATAHTAGIAVVGFTLVPFEERISASILGRLQVSAGSAEIEPTALLSERPTERLSDWVLAQAADAQIEHAVDLRPVLGCGSAGVTCPQFRRASRDAVHWNEAGHRLVAETLQRQVFFDCE